MTSSANLSIGLVDLPTLAAPLAAAGLRVIGGGGFREAAAEIKTSAEQGPVAAIFVADHPQPGIKAWLTRMSAHGAVVVVVRADLPRLDIDDTVSVDLPATVAELLAAAGLTASSPAAGAVKIGLDGETAAQDKPAFLDEPAADSAEAAVFKTFDDAVTPTAGEPAAPFVPVTAPMPTERAEVPPDFRADTRDARRNDDRSQPAVALPVAPLEAPPQQAIPRAAAPEPFRGVGTKFADARGFARSDDSTDIGVRVAAVAQLPLRGPALRQPNAGALSPWDDAPSAHPAAVPEMVAPVAHADGSSMQLASPWDAGAVDNASETATVTPFVLPALTRETDWFGAAAAPMPGGLGDRPRLRQQQPRVEAISATPAHQPAPDPMYIAADLVSTASTTYVNPHDAIEAMFAAAADMPDATPWGQPRRGRGRGSPLAIVCAEKGGVGKTNTTLALAQRAADLAPNKRVVLIDMNRGQGDVRKYLKLGGAQVHSILDAAISGNIADAVLSPEQITAARHESLPPISFGVVLAPEPEAADPRVVTPDVYQRVIDLVRGRADLVVIDTQIVEIHDTSGLVDGLIVPALTHDAYGVTLTDTSAPGVQNLVTMLIHFAQQGVPANRLMIVINRALQGYDTNVLRGMLTKYGTFAGAVEEKPLLARQANMGRIPHNDPVLAPVLDAVLLRVTGWPCFQPVPVAPPKKNKLFSFGRKSA